MNHSIIAKATLIDGSTLDLSKEALAMYLAIPRLLGNGRKSKLAILDELNYELPPMPPLTQEQAAELAATDEIPEPAAPKAKRGVKENPNGIQATLKREWTKTVDSGVQTVRTETIVNAVRQHCNAHGGSYSYDQVSRQIGPISRKMGIKKGSYGVWMVAPID